MPVIGHRSQGDPCAKCGAPALKHNRQHAPDGDPCTCGAKARYHGKPKKSGPSGPSGPRGEKAKPYFVGIDGEGQGRNPHRYLLLAYSNADGTKRAHVENREGLSTEECLDFLLSIPQNTKRFAYAFNYDLTKMLTDVDDRVLFYLFRPETRRRTGKYAKAGPRPVRWGKYYLNYQGTKFTVARSKSDPRKVIVWDIFKFYQSKFVNALRDWKVGTKEELDRMQAMKDQRAYFDRLSWDEVRAYCFDECAKLATLAEKLVDAHEAAGLTLNTFYGAGSTGGAILKKLGIHEQKRDGLPKMTKAVASAFFGGRFENSVIGEVDGPLWSYDISSAYPYQTAFLPCLACGRWRRTKKESDAANATVALVRYSLGKAPRELSWGPFPFRMADGSICFPAESGGGWVWGEEFFAGAELFPHVGFREAWVYDTSCDHSPFAEIPEFYKYRLRIGKEGPGIVVKLGVNSVYGKLAQSIGDNPPFQSWIWAGMITSGTRAQILQAIGCHGNRDNLLMVATDGICSRERLKLPRPLDTGTYDARDTDGTPKPLGGWEEKQIKKGVFFARPGIYFPMAPTGDEIKAIKARGVGKAVMYDAWESLVSAWREKKASVVLADVTRFAGAKSCISRGRDKKAEVFLYRRSELYGEWPPRPIELSFNPLPKRERWDDAGRLEIRRMPFDLESVPYDRSIMSQEAQILRAATAEALEQPDGGDYCEYEVE